MMYFPYTLLCFTAALSTSFSSPVTRSAYTNNQRGTTIQIISPTSNLDGISVYESTTGKENLLSKLIVRPRVKTFAVFLTHLGDLSSWELAQKLVYYIPKIDDAKLNLVAIAPGATVENAAEFSFRTKFPLERLYLDPEARSYEALKFEKGFLPNAKVSPYLKLLPMLAGIQSQGTIPEVLRGYFGDRSASSDWIKPTLR
jgi:hypothetical protein